MNIHLTVAPLRGLARSVKPAVPRHNVFNPAVLGSFGDEGIVLRLGDLVVPLARPARVRLSQAAAIEEASFGVKVHPFSQLGRSGEAGLDHILKKSVP
jgi:hypothetical protein